MFSFVQSTPFVLSEYGHRRYGPAYSDHSEDAYFAALSQKYEHVARARQHTFRAQAERHRDIERQQRAQDQPFEDTIRYISSLRHYQRQPEGEHAGIFREAKRQYKAHEAHKRAQQRAILIEQEVSTYTCLHVITIHNADCGHHVQQHRRRPYVNREAAQHQEKHGDIVARAIHRALLDEQAHKVSLLPLPSSPPWFCLHDLQFHQEHRHQEDSWHQQESFALPDESGHGEAPNLLSFLRIFTGREPAPQTTLPVCQSLLRT